MTDALIEQRTVVLTASTLQRIGAFAIAALAERSHPEQLSVDEFDKVVELMTSHLQKTASVPKPADPGGFWLAASYALWPNSGINPTIRGRQTAAQRRESIGAWRRRPEEAEWPGVPCAYCDRAACGWFGKVDIPLGASVEYRNTTAPGQNGTPLCFACVASLWAFPYGADLSGGRAAAIHSWDDVFLSRMTRIAVERTLSAAESSAAKVKHGPYARELTVLQRVRSYDRRIHAGVELIVLSNSNKEQSLRVQEMTQPSAQWLRTTATDTERRAGYGALVVAQTAKSVPGEAFLAKRVFDHPVDVLYRTVNYLRERLSDKGSVPGESMVLAPLVNSYCIEVLGMDEKDVAQIGELAQRLAALLGQDSRPGPFRDFVRANAKGGDLDGWFRSNSVTWLLTARPEGMPQVLLSTRESRLLFDGDGRWAHRRLLFFAVIEALAARNWKPKGSPEELEELAAEAGKPAADHHNEEHSR
ncbi:hypothetical protein OHB26_00365 [Nocardia sp. NBC_01503]|uniref:hypothetical protein n=1 Tax=Nocardia sp. NBC_01503 TaxID=2975997 RepID=UPI002E7AD31A|nr:hypothetical protein [Nocardia sp. NBC_01503]WTL32768.1 hypothetical protein OHB26_00365 [Nocardia sp. NBC_01503]